MVSKEDLDSKDGLENLENAPARNGTVRVEKGKVLVRDPVGNGEPATIEPGLNVEVFVDGKKITEKTEVTSKNKIEIKPATISPKQEIKVRIDKDKMKAYLSVTRTPGRTYEVEDRREVKDLVIDAVRSQEQLPDPPTFDEIKKALSEKGIVYGIKTEAIAEAIAAGDGQEVVVASGTPPVKGKDAYIELSYKKMLQRNQEDSLRVDTLDYGRIVSVEPGTLVARKIPPEPGTPGINVLGEKVAPPAPKDLELRAGKGVELRNDGLEAVAVISGRPEIKGSSVFISPVHTVYEDVGKKTGNIYFKGDVVIEGNVLDGMTVRATGNVTVKGSATHCSIFAGGDIVINRSAVSATVKAGNKGVQLHSVKDKLLSLSTDVERVVDAFYILAKNPNFTGRAEVKKYGIGVGLKLLFDTKYLGVQEKFKKLYKEIMEMDDNAAERHLGKEFVLFLNRAKEIITGRGALEFKSVERVKDFVSEFKEIASDAAADIERSLKQNSSITVGYAQHSTLEAVGDVIITGRGAYNTQIFAGGNVVVKNPKGFFRGGEIVAEGSVEIYELGSEGGAITTVSVPAGQDIKYTVVHSGVKLKVGTTIKKFEMKIGDLEAQERKR
ncbi:MAG: DUF342 domain-containing protein [Clostridia bacterium]|nr:DUF342 domain-containing protein [Clostridia bacterium]